MKRTEEILDFDFGFSFIDDEIEEVKQAAEDRQTNVEELSERLDLLYRSIVPFLDNLCKSPEKSTIYWPDRVKKIEAYKQKLKQIAEGN